MLKLPDRTTPVLKPPTVRAAPAPASFRLPVLVAALIAASTLASAQPAAADLDAVFVLDTTGSMRRELKEVQERVQQLAVSLARARVGERIRFGIVAYRDRGDDYVTAVSPLSEDVETARDFLAGLSANGGGDGPESVVAALDAALSMAWDTAESTDRQAFLIGDAPPHLDYDDEPTPEELIAEARRRRVVINTIGCRSLPPHGVSFFRAIAYATEGSYQHIGRVRAARRGALTEALSRTAAPSAAAAPGEEVPLRWQHHREAETSSILVRQGGPGGVGQSPEGAGLLPCTLEVSLPPGLGLGADPRARLGPGGLEVELTLAAGEGGVDLFSLDRCPQLSTPIHVGFGGS